MKAAEAKKKTPKEPQQTVRADGRAENFAAHEVAACSQLSSSQ